MPKYIETVDNDPKNRRKKNKESYLLSRIERGWRRQFFFCWARPDSQTMSPSTKVRSDKISSSDKLVIVLAFSPLDKIYMYKHCHMHNGWTILSCHYGRMSNQLSNSDLKRETVCSVCLVLYFILSISWSQTYLTFPIT